MSIPIKKSSKILAIAALMVVVGCRGTVSDKPPVHPVLNMDFQERFEAQEENEFFADGRAMRLPVAGTIPRGFLREDTEFYFGRHEDGVFVGEIPIAVTADLIRRGQSRYEIFCTPCHGSAGDGQGIVSIGGYGMVPPPTYHDDRLRDVEDGYLFDVISRGVRTMQGYGYQIAPVDRWAIVSYVRSLQRSQNAGVEDVPADVLQEMNQ